MSEKILIVDDDLEAYGGMRGLELPQKRHQQSTAQSIGGGHADDTGRH